MNLLGYGSMFDIGWVMGIIDVRSTTGGSTKLRRRGIRRIRGRRV